VVLDSLLGSVKLIFNRDFRPVINVSIKTNKVYYTTNGEALTNKKVNLSKQIR